MALLQATSLFVHLDPRKPGVQVPQWFKKDPRLVLQFGMNMAVPIRDLHVGDEGIAGTLSFSRQPHYCFLPWAAVFAMVGEDGRGMVWPDDVPPELAVQGGQSSAKPPRAHLRAVREGDDTDSSAAESEQSVGQAPEESPAAPSEGARMPAPRAPERSVVVIPAEPPIASPSDAAGPPDAAGAEAYPPTPPDGDGPAPERKSKRPPYLRVVK